MAYQVIWSESATADLQQIVEFIATDDPNAAREFGLTIIDRVEQVAPSLEAVASFYVFPSVVWALLNLMPVWPLDGGRIARSVVLLSGGTTSQALWISIVCAGGLSLYAFRAGQSIMGIFFLMFAISNYQLLQQPGGWR